MKKASVGARRPITLIILAAVASALLAGLGGVFLYRNTQRLSASTQWVSHSHEVQLALQRAILLTERIESSGSIYALNRSQEQVDFARLSLIRLHTSAVGLRTMVADNRNQTPNLNALDACTAELDQQFKHIPLDGLGVRSEALRCHQALQLMFDQEQQLLEERRELSRSRTHFQFATEIALVLSSIVILSVLYGLLMRDAVQRSRFTRESARTNQQLERSVVELKDRAAEASLIGAARHELQLCTTAEQIYRSATARMAQLLSGTAGTLYVVNSSRNLLEAVATWGSHTNASVASDVIAPVSCCGLRSGQLRWRRPGISELDCDHFQGAAPESYLCVPLIAHGEALGVVFIECSTEETVEIVEHRSDGVQQFVQLTAMSLAALQLRTKLENQSIRDSLTGLFNRHFMQIAFDRELLRAQRRKNTLAVLMLDVDHFKKFNDQYGHAAGDAALTEVAKVFRNQVRNEDIVCRYGGEEFAIILPEITAEAAYDRAERIRKAVAELRVPIDRTRTVEVTVSIGVALYPGDGSSSAALLKSADKALYGAKHNGRNQVVLA